MFRSKLPHLETSIFTIMSKMANEHQAINLSQGFPNFPEDPYLIELTKELATKNTHQYTPMSGHLGLLDKIEKLTKTNYARSIKADQNILITCGATQAIFCTLQTLVHPQDEVIILDPSYDSYETPIILSGGIPIRIPLTLDYTPDFEKIRASITRKTKVLIINNPHNPSGRVWEESIIEQIEALMLEYPQLYLLSDEVYEYITFEKPHISINSREKIRDRTIITSSFGKTLHVTGWKIGYVIAHEDIMNEIKKIHQFNVFSVNSLSQAVIDRYLENFDFQSVRALYQKKRNYFTQLMSNTAFELLPCEGTYFQVASYEAYSTDSEIEFTKGLVTGVGVATIPISTFYSPVKNHQRIRLCFAKDDSTLEQAVERLSKLSIK